VLTACRSLNHSLGTNLNRSKILPTISGFFSHLFSHHVAEVGMKTFLMCVCFCFPSYIGTSEDHSLFCHCSSFSVAQICCSASFMHTVPVLQFCEMGKEKERDTQTHAVPGINSIFTSLKMFNILSLVLGHTQKSVRWMSSNPK